MSKKYLTILCDGMADRDDARGLTPMDEAKKPTMDFLCAHGFTGLVQTVPAGMKPGSDVCNLAALGYDPRECYTGRSPLEALSMGIPLADDDVTLRTNLVTLSNDAELKHRTMLDYSAGEISTAEARELIDALKAPFARLGIELHAGVSYRHAAVLRNTKKTGATFTPPHDITNRNIAQYLPQGGSADLFIKLIECSIEIFENHRVNLDRIKRGKNPATSVWFWGEGTKPKLDLFRSKFDKSAAVISAVDLVKGIGIGGGMHVVDIPTATGTVDTDYNAKTQAAKKALLTDGFDYCFVHLEGPDECGHQGDRHGKILSIERIDEFIVKPLYDALMHCGAPFAISVMPDHATPLSVRTHTSEPIPFLIYDSERTQTGTEKFSEKQAALTGVKFENGFDVINKLFN